ncbi:hypothetical protein R83H12_03174 [Fibrobacteria bacterium R8-3-H12]
MSVKFFCADKGQADPARTIIILIFFDFSLNYLYFHIYIGIYFGELHPVASRPRGIRFKFRHKSHSIDKYTFFSPCWEEIFEKKSLYAKVLPKNAQKCNGKFMSVQIAGYVPRNNLLCTRSKFSIIEDILDIKHLSHKQKTNLGSFYTPSHLVRLVYEILAKNINVDVVLEPACGYGAFFAEKFPQEKARFIGTDIDPVALDIASKKFPNVEFKKANVLSQISRSKFGIGENEKLAIIGNPPYNDVTNLNT